MRPSAACGSERAQALHHRRERCAERLDVATCRGPTDREAKRADRDRHPSQRGPAKVRSTPTSRPNRSVPPRPPGRARAARPRLARRRRRRSRCGALARAGSPSDNDVGDRPSRHRAERIGEAAGGEAASAAKASGLGERGRSRSETDDSDARSRSRPGVPVPAHPPMTNGSRRRPRRTTRAPIPGGPPSLWALTETRSAPSASRSTGT